LRAKLFPSIPDLLFCAILLWLFVAGAGWSVLLADGDTGWHIRNGEEILKCRCVPHADAFAFGTEGRAWFAWEWMADALFAFLRQSGGLKAVVFFAGIAIAAVPAILFRHLRWKGGGLFVSLAVTILATGASSIHFLARPHIFTLLFTAGASWWLDRDRAQPRPGIWILPIAVALWTNLHGGFLVAFTLLGARLIESTFLRRSSLRRDLGLTGVCALATLLNPYGWRLHEHVFEYLRSDWIRQAVDEFQSPRFRSESMLQFEILLAVGTAILPSLWRRRKVADLCLILFWAWQSLGSVRHVPIYCLLAAPPITFELENLWKSWTASRAAYSLAGMLREIDTDWKRFASGLSVVPAAFCLVLALVPGQNWPEEFPVVKFPIVLVARNARRLNQDAADPIRVFSSDQWSDYLIYRLYPRVRTFFDGRSDFFGPWRGDDYARLMEGRPDCPSILEREKVRYVLIPSTWALAGILASDRSWTKVDGDRQAVLFEHSGGTQSGF
jgi:hypothetical protein